PPQRTAVALARCAALPPGAAEATASRRSSEDLVRPQRLHSRHAALRTIARPAHVVLVAKATTAMRFFAPGDDAMLRRDKESHRVVVVERDVDCFPPALAHQWT